MHGFQQLPLTEAQHECYDWRELLPRSAQLWQFTSESGYQEANMAIEVTALRAEHGYVCIVLFLAILVHHLYMAFGVTSARKKYEDPSRCLFLPLTKLETWQR